MAFLHKGVFVLFIVFSTILLNEEYNFNGTVTDKNGESISDVRLELHDHQGNLIAFDSTSNDGTYQFSYIPTSLEESENEISDFKLGEAYPNPILKNTTSGKTKIPFQVSKSHTYQVEVYTITGQLVTRTEQSLHSGTYTVNVGMPKAAGVYLVRVTGNGVSKVRKITSMMGSSASINITPGRHLKSSNVNRKKSASSQVLTLKLIGGADYMDQELEIDEPGDYTHNFVLESVNVSACEDVKLAATSGLPSNMISINGITDDFGDEPNGWVRIPDEVNNNDTEQIPAYIERINDTEVEFLVPVHPIDNMEGGDIELIISNEEETVSCAGLEFEIEPMEPAPGTLANSVDELQDAFEDLAGSFGYDPEELKSADVHSLDTFIQSIALGLQMIDGASNPNNLKNILAGTAPIFDEYENSEEQFELVEAVMAVSDFSGKLSELSGNLKSAAQHAGYNPLDRDSWPELENAKLNDRELPDEFASPKGLDDLMASQSAYAAQNDGLLREIEEVAGLALGSVSITTGLTGFAPISTATGLSAMVISLNHIAMDIAENTLPSELQSLELTAEPLEYIEEEVEPGKWGATIVARSNGYTLDTPTILSNIPGLGKASSILRQKGVISELTEELTDLAIDIFQTHFTAIMESGEGPFTIDPKEWGVVIEPGLDGVSDHFDWELSSQEKETDIDPFEFEGPEEENESNYSPKAVGKADLIVRTESDKYQGQLRVANVSLEMKKIEINIQENSSRGSRTTHRIGVGENYQIELWAEVENAVDKRVEWNYTVEEGPEPLIFEPTITNEEPILLVAPEEEALYAIEAKTLTTDGLRGLDEAPQRNATTYVLVEVEEEVESLTVTPDPACVELDMTPPPFTAYLGTEEIPITDLSHEIDGPGTLSSDGAYQPSAQGFVTIYFTYEDSDLEEPLSAEVNFIARDECGQISVQSSEFNYTTHYASATVNDHEEFGGDLFSSFNGTWSSDPTTIVISAGTDISDEGEWSRDFYWTTGSPDPNWWQIATFVDAFGDEWAVDSDEAMISNDEDIKLTINRVEETFEGVQLGIFDGEFTLPFRNVTASIERGEDITTVITGQIQSIPLDVGPNPEPDN